MNILNKYFDKIYVATYENSNRIEYIKNVLNDVKYELYFGFDCTKMTDDYYNKYLSNRKPNSHLLKKGMLGCTMTHIQLYNKIYEEKLNNVLILEDDILLNENINNLDYYYSQLTNNWDILYLGLNNTHINYNDILKPNINKNIFEMNVNNYFNLEGTSAFVLKNYEIAGELSDFNNRELYTADGALMEFLKKKKSTYCVFLPQLITQNENILTTSNY